MKSISGILDDIQTNITFKSAYFFALQPVLNALESSGILSTQTALEAIDAAIIGKLTPGLQRFYEDEGVSNTIITVINIVTSRAIFSRSQRHIEAISPYVQPLIIDWLGKAPGELEHARGIALETLALLIQAYPNYPCVLPDYKTAIGTASSYLGDDSLSLEDRTRLLNVIDANCDDPEVYHTVVDCGGYAALAQLLEKPVLLYGGSIETDNITNKCLNVLTKMAQQYGINGDQIPCLLRVAQKYEHHDKSVSKRLGQCISIGFQNDKNDERILSALRENSADKDELLATLVPLSYSFEVCNRIAKNDGLSLLVNELATTTNAVSLDGLTKALGCLSGSSAHTENMIDLGLNQILLSRLTAVEDNGSALHMLHLLAHLCRSTEAAEKFISEDGISHMSALIERFSHDTRIGQGILQVLHSVGSHPACAESVAGSFYASLLDEVVVARCGFSRDDERIVSGDDEFITDFSLLIKSLSESKVPSAIMESMMKFLSNDSVPDKALGKLAEALCALKMADFHERNAMDPTAVSVETVMSFTYNVLYKMNHADSHYSSLVKKFDNMLTAETAQEYISDVQQRLSTIAASTGKLQKNDGGKQLAQAENEFKKLCVLSQTQEGLRACTASGDDMYNSVESIANHIFKMKNDETKKALVSAYVSSQTAFTESVGVVAQLTRLFEKGRQQAATEDMQKGCSASISQAINKGIGDLVNAYSEKHATNPTEVVDLVNPLFCDNLEDQHITTYIADVIRNIMQKANESTMNHAMNLGLFTNIVDALSKYPFNEDLQTTLLETLVFVVNRSEPAAQSLRKTNIPAVLTQAASLHKANPALLNTCRELSHKLVPKGMKREQIAELIKNISATPYTRGPGVAQLIKYFATLNDLTTTSEDRKRLISHGIVATLTMLITQMNANTPPNAQDSALHDSIATLISNLLRQPAAVNQIERSDIPAGLCASIVSLYEHFLTVDPSSPEHSALQKAMAGYIKALAELPEACCEYFPAIEHIAADLLDRRPHDVELNNAILKIQMLDGVSDKTLLPTLTQNLVHMINNINDEVSTASALGLERALAKKAGSAPIREAIDVNQVFHILKTAPTPVARQNLVHLLKKLDLSAWSSDINDVVEKVGILSNLMMSGDDVAIVKDLLEIGADLITEAVATYPDAAEKLSDSSAVYTLVKTAMAKLSPSDSSKDINRIMECVPLGETVASVLADLNDRISPDELLGLMRNFCLTVRNGEISIRDKEDGFEKITAIAGDLMGKNLSNTEYIQEASAIIHNIIAAIYDMDNSSIPHLVESVSNNLQVPLSNKLIMDSTTKVHLDEFLGLPTENKCITTIFNLQSDIAKYQASTPAHDQTAQAILEAAFHVIQHPFSEQSKIAALKYITQLVESQGEEVVRFIDSDSSLSTTIMNNSDRPSSSPVNQLIKNGAAVASCPTIIALLDDLTEPNLFTGQPAHAEALLTALNSIMSAQPNKETLALEIEPLLADVRAAVPSALAGTLMIELLKHSAKPESTAGTVGEDEELPETELEEYMAQLSARIDDPHSSQETLCQIAEYVVQCLKAEPELAINAHVPDLLANLLNAIVDIPYDSILSSLQEACGENLATASQLARILVPHMIEDCDILSNPTMGQNALDYLGAVANFDSVLSTIHEMNGIELLLDALRTAAPSGTQLFDELSALCDQIEVAEPKEITLQTIYEGILAYSKAGDKMLSIDGNTVIYEYLEPLQSKLYCAIKTPIEDPMELHNIWYGLESITLLCQEPSNKAWMNEFGIDRLLATGMAYQGHSGHALAVVFSTAMGLKDLQKETVHTLAVSSVILPGFAALLKALREGMPAPEPSSVPQLAELLEPETLCDRTVQFLEFLVHIIQSRQYAAETLLGIELVTFNLAARNEPFDSRVRSAAIEAMVQYLRICLADETDNIENAFVDHFIHSELIDYINGNFDRFDAPEVVCSSARFMVNASRIGILKTTMTELGMVVHVLEYLRKMKSKIAPNTVDALAYSCLAIGTTTLNNTTAVNQFLNNKGMKVIIQLLEQGSSTGGDAEITIASKACIILCNASYKHDSVKKAFCVASGAAPLLATIRNHYKTNTDAVDQLITNCCKAISNLILWPESDEMFMKHGLMGMFKELVNDSQTTPASLASILACLNNALLDNSKSAVEAAGQLLPGVIRLMNDPERADSKIYTNCLNFLELASNTNNDNALLAAGALPHIFPKLDTLSSSNLTNILGLISNVFQVADELDASIKNKSVELVMNIFVNSQVREIDRLSCIALQETLRSHKDNTYAVSINLPAVLCQKLSDATTKNYAIELIRVLLILAHIEMIKNGDANYYEAEFTTLSTYDDTEERAPSTTNVYITDDEDHAVNETVKVYLRTAGTIQELLFIPDNLLRETITNMATFLDRRNGTNYIAPYIVKMIEIFVCEKSHELANTLFETSLFVTICNLSTSSEKDWDLALSMANIAASAILYSSRCYWSLFGDYSEFRKLLNTHSNTLALSNRKSRKFIKSVLQLIDSAAQNNLQSRAIVGDLQPLCPNEFSAIDIFGREEVRGVAQLSGDLKQKLRAGGRLAIIIRETNVPVPAQWKASLDLNQLVIVYDTDKTISIAARKISGIGYGCSSAEFTFAATTGKYSINPKACITLETLNGTLSLIFSGTGDRHNFVELITPWREAIMKN